jgi:hypothetical protein
MVVPKLLLPWGEVAQLIVAMPYAAVQVIYVVLEDSTVLNDVASAVCLKFLIDVLFLYVFISFDLVLQLEHFK